MPSHRSPTIQSPLDPDLARNREYLAKYRAKRTSQVKQWEELKEDILPILDEGIQETISMVDKNDILRALRHIGQLEGFLSRRMRDLESVPTQPSNCNDQFNQTHWHSNQHLVLAQGESFSPYGPSPPVPTTQNSETQHLELADDWQDQHANILREFFPDEYR